MIRIICWAFLAGMLTGVFLKKEEIDVLGYLIWGGLFLLLISYVREFMVEHNMSFTFEDLW